MERLGFGIATFPKGVSKKDPIAAIQAIHDLGLDCLELEFAHGIRMKDETAGEINRFARKLGVTLTAHAPYYINLNAKEQDKIDASINRLLQTARLAGMCGAYSMTFHAAFYMKDDPTTVFSIVKKYLNQISDKLKDDANQIQLRPELTGKKTHFGNLEELCSLSKEVSQVYPCLDFSHFENGSEEMNSYEYFSDVFERYRKSLGRTALSQLHIHVAGIETGSKGEMKTIPLSKSTFNARDFLRACHDHSIKGSVICDSPEQETDALMLKNIWLEVQAMPKTPKKSAASKKVLH